jgi:hypothetical protein
MYNSIFFRSEDSLRALIQKRHNDRAATADNFFSALEAKYGGKASKERSTKKRKQKKESDDEDDSDSEDAKPKRGKKGRTGKK